MRPDDDSAALEWRRTDERAWWLDLVHPLPLGAAALLFANDHLLKGSGVLPGWVTGKLSDFAGLFVFPVLVVASLTWGLARLGKPLPAHRTPILVGVVVAVTGLLFAALKLIPAVNHVVSAILGPNSMDATDLGALVALPASGLWMVRRAGAGRSSPAPGRLRGVAAVFVALACVATSAQPKEPLPPPPQPVRPVPRHKACGAVTPVTCRYDATRYTVKLSGRKVIDGACTVRIGQVYSVPQEGDNMPVADNPVVDLGDKEASLFGAWGRYVPKLVAPAGTAPPGTAPPGAAPSAAAAPGPDRTKLRVLVQQHGSDPEGPMEDDSLLEVTCRAGFTEDTLPPTQVAR